MTMKRKRSTSTSAFSPMSDSSTSSTYTQDSPTRIPFFYNQTKPLASPQSQFGHGRKTENDGLSGHMNSRTRKRHRDDRPDEEQVQAATISRLFNAQRQQSQIAFDSMDLSQTLPTPPRPLERPQRSTLHSFWQLPPSNINIVQNIPLRQSGPPSMSCEGCDRPIRLEDAMEMDDNAAESHTACAWCHKHVCDLCAVQGDVRRCLECAMSGG